MTDTEYILIFNACSMRNVEAASRVYFPLPELSRKIERDSACRVSRGGLLIRFLTCAGKFW